jgi:hypothetical protein
MQGYAEQSTEVGNAYEAIYDFYGRIIKSDSSSKNF